MKFTHNYEESFFPRNRINCRICPLLSFCHPLASLLRSHPFANLLLSVLDFNLRLSPIQIIRRNCPGRLISLWVSPQILGYRGSTRETGLIKSLTCWPKVDGLRRKDNWRALGIFLPPMPKNFICCYSCLIILRIFKVSKARTTEVGIYKRKQDSKKTRKQELDQESDQENKNSTKKKNLSFILL